MTGDWVPLSDCLLSVLALRETGDFIFPSVAIISVSFCLCWFLYVQMGFKLFYNKLNNLIIESTESLSRNYELDDGAAAYLFSEPLIDQFPSLKASSWAWCSSDFLHHCRCAQEVEQQSATICFLPRIKRWGNWVGLEDMPEHGTCARAHTMKHKHVFVFHWWNLSRSMMYVPVANNRMKFYNGVFFINRELSVL